MRFINPSLEGQFQNEKQMLPKNCTRCRFAFTPGSAVCTGAETNRSDQAIRTNCRQHHARPAARWLSAKRYLLVAGQPTRLFPLEAGGRTAPERDESLRRQSRRKRPASLN